MVYFVPKVMIYRTGKYTPYKGKFQEIEMMLKFINNEETQKATIYFSKLSDDQNPQESDMHEINEVAEAMESSLLVDQPPNTDEPTTDQAPLPFNSDKIAKAQTLNADIELPKGKITIDLKDAIDPAGGGNLITGNAEEKRSEKELLEVLSENGDLPFMYKIVGNSNILKFPVTLKDSFDIDTYENEKQE